MATRDVVVIGCYYRIMRNKPLWLLVHCLRQVSVGVGGCCIQAIGIGFVYLKLLVFMTGTCLWSCRVTGGELFDDIVAREFYSEKDAR